MFDLSQYDSKKFADEGAKLELALPDGTPVFTDEEGEERATITLLGQDSKTFTALTHNKNQARLKRGARRAARISTRELEEDALDLAVACTRDWNLPPWDGERLECTAANARKVYKAFPWILDQVSDFIVDRSNFLGN